MIWKSKEMEKFAFNVCAGMEVTHAGRLKQIDIGAKCGALIRADADLDRFAIIISGGGGNGPLFPGYVGKGMADAAVIGAAYAAPNAYAIYEVGKRIGKNGGVLLLYNNFAGDYLNNDMAKELLEMEGFEVRDVICTDDIATALGESKENRSGRGGVALLIKLAGACAEKGMTLSETVNILNKAKNRLGSLSMHVDFKNENISFGAGFSGEPGVKNINLCDPSEAALIALKMLTQEIKPQYDETLFVMVNRLRLTSYADSYIMTKYIYDALSSEYNVKKIRNGAFSNILDIFGYDISILCMDAEIETLMNTEVYGDSFVL